MYLNIKPRNTSPTKTVAPMKVNVYMTPDLPGDPEPDGEDGDGDAVALVKAALACNSILDMARSARSPQLRHLNMPCVNADRHDCMCKEETQRRENNNTHAKLLLSSQRNSCAVT